MKTGKEIMMGKVVLRLTTAQVLENSEVAENVQSFDVLVTDGPDAIQEAIAKIELAEGEFVSEVARICFLYAE